MSVIFSHQLTEKHTTKSIPVHVPDEFKFGKVSSKPHICVCVCVCEYIWLRTELSLKSQFVLYRDNYFSILNTCISQLVDCKVKSKSAAGLEVVLLPSGTSAFIPTAHLSDHHDNWPVLLEMYDEGDVITDAICCSVVKEEDVNWIFSKWQHSKYIWGITGTLSTNCKGETL